MTVGTRRLGVLRNLLAEELPRASGGNTVWLWLDCLWLFGRLLM